MTPEISFRNFEATEGVKELVTEEIEKLETFYDRIIACGVVMEVPHRRHEEGNLFRVRIRLTIPGHELVVSRDPAGHQAHEDPYVSIRDAFAAMRRRLERHVERMRGKVKNHEVPPFGWVVRLFKEDGYGFIQAPDGREVYFHRNSVVDCDFERLTVGTEVRFAERQGLEGPQASTVRTVGKHHPLG